MSRWKQFIITLFIGIGIGSSAPFITGWISTLERYTGPSSFISTPVSPAASSAAASTPASTNTTVADAAAIQQPENYHFVLNNKTLSIVKGKPGENGDIILSGLDVKVWPVELLEMAPQVVFNSLDEVQSFIDSASESLWTE